jgi:hypothetical protein
MKSFTIDAFFPEVKPAHAAFQSTTKLASNIGVAAVRAMNEIRARPALKGKRITEVRLTVKELLSAAKSNLRGNDA